MNVGFFTIPYQQQFPVSPSKDSPFLSPLISRTRSFVFGSICGSIATSISLMVTVISFFFGSSRAKANLGVPQPYPLKKIRTFFASSSWNIFFKCSRASSVITTIRTPFPFNILFYSTCFILQSSSMSSQK